MKVISMQVLNANKYKIFNDPMIVRVLFIFICNINKIDIQKVFRFTLKRPQYIYTIPIFSYRKVQRNQTYLYYWVVTTSALLTADFYMASTKNVKHNEAPLQESTTFLLKLYSTFYIVYNTSTLWCVLKLYFRHLPVVNKNKDIKYITRRKIIL